MKMGKRMVDRSFVLFPSTPQTPYWAVFRIQAVLRDKEAVLWRFLVRLLMFSSGRSS